MNFGYLGVASALHDAAAVENILAGLTGDLQAAGGRPVDTPDVDAPLAVVVLTGGTEQQVIRAAAARPAGEPVVVVAHPWHNALPATLEAVARLHSDGRPARIVVLDGGGRAGADLADAVADVAVARWLRGMRIGLLGAASDWLVASTPEPEVVRAVWGPTVVPVDIADVLDGYGRTDPSAGSALGATVTAGATGVDGADGAVGADGAGRTAVEAAARVHPVLTDLVGRHRLDALTVRCFDLVTQVGTTGCLALAELNDAGVTAGCEGDLPSTIAMAWTGRLLGRLPWMANPAQVRVDEGLLVLAHCTVPRSLTTGYRLTTHFESGLGAALDGDLPPGPVTLVRIGGRDLRRTWIAEGEAVPAPVRPGLCRTQLTVRLPASAVEELLTAPLGNHVVVVPGRHRTRLTRWLATMRVPADPGPTV